MSDKKNHAEYLEEYLTEYKDALNIAIAARKKFISAALEAESKEYLQQFGGAADNEAYRGADHEAYREKVLPYWERFGYVPEEFWFEFSGSRDHVMDPRMIPLDLLYNEIVPYLNNMQLRTAVSDKAYCDTWFPDVKQAVTVCRRVSGIYYDDSMNIISEDEAVKLCLDSPGFLFVKPAVYTHSSKGITAADAGGLSDADVKRIFDATGMNFIVQQEIEQHPGLAALNPDSVCTVRINTLLMDDDVHILTEVMKVGAPGEKVPVHGKGSYFTQILGDGSLHERAIFVYPKNEEYGATAYIAYWGDAKEYGLYDESYRVPCLDELRRFAKKLHERIAHFRFAGWDLTLDRDGDPVLIEVNFSPGPFGGQLGACTPMFGDMTDRVLEDYFFERSLEKTQMQGLLVQ